MIDCREVGALRGAFLGLELEAVREAEVRGHLRTCPACAAELNCLRIENCDNGQDDNGNGRIDCADADCQGKPGCGDGGAEAPANCSLAAVASPAWHPWPGRPQARP